MSKSYDAFMSHASEDKEEFVNHLVKALKKRECRIWYDMNQIDYGDLFETRIYEGIENSRFALFVITPTLERKPETAWVWREFNIILEQERRGKISIIPILYKVTIQEVQQYARNNPTLNTILNTIVERHSLRTFVAGGIYGVAEELKNRFDRR
jgi:hypothetical protein